MTPERRLDDERLARMIGSVGAEPDAAVLARAKARIAAGAGEERWEFVLPAGVAWLFRPLALTGAATACAIALATGLWFGGAPTATTATSLLVTSSETLPGALLDELDAGEPASPNGGLRDSGGPS